MMWVLSVGVFYGRLYRLVRVAACWEGSCVCAGGRLTWAQKVAGRGHVEGFLEADDSLGCVRTRGRLAWLEVLKPPDKIDLGRGL